MAMRDPDRLPGHHLILRDDGLFDGVGWYLGRRGRAQWVELTRMPSQRDTARNGRSARSVRIERKAGISAAPAKVAAKLINDSYRVQARKTHRVSRLSSATDRSLSPRANDYNDGRFQGSQL